MTTLNTRLNTARKKRDDEYYTLPAMVKQELDHYKSHFFNKKVHCPCDHSHSAFVRYFQENYKQLGLAGLTYSSTDFMSDKNQALIDASDIIVTNPPFSLIKDFYRSISHKQFLIVCPHTFPTRGYILPHIHNQTLWLGRGGISSVSEARYKFLRPDNTLKSAPYVWLQNIEPYYYNGPLKRAKKPPTSWAKYDNLNAIEVKPVNYFPYFQESDYRTERAGVPISFLTVWNPARFTLHTRKVVNPLLHGKPTFDRLIVSINHNT